MTYEMAIIDRGSGPPLVLVPGIQGRWEYMRPAVDALSASFRVITFSLCHERPSAVASDPARGLDAYVSQISSVLREKDVDRAIVLGVSFGGLVALRFAAVHPERTSALVLASTPAPRLRLRRRHRIYLRLPRILGPLFLIETPWRVHAEVVSALPGRHARWTFKRNALRTLVSAPFSFSRMAARARLVASADLRDDCSRVTAPTLIVTGERLLDHVVPVQGSLEYERLIPNARYAMLERTGHLGSITRPDVFAALVRDFVNGQRHAAA